MITDQVFLLLFLVILHFYWPLFVSIIRASATTMLTITIRLLCICLICVYSKRANEFLLCTTFRFVYFLDRNKPFLRITCTIVSVRIDSNMYTKKREHVMCKMFYSKYHLLTHTAQHSTAAQYRGDNLKVLLNIRWNEQAIHHMTI